MLSKQFWNSLLMFVWSASPVIALPQPTTPATGVVQQPDGPWDYIVVGSGPGGGPLAARLAIAGSKVLLIEAGSDQGDNDRVRVPSLWPLSSQYTPMQWDYFVNHFQDPARAQLDPKFSWKMPNGSYHVGPNPPEGSEPLGILYPRAGTLGGCAAHNALITVYPHDSDWTDMVTLTGDKSWSPGSMRKYYEKLERNEYLRGHTDGHGQDGWLGTNVLNPSSLVEDTKMTCHAAAAGALIKNRPVAHSPKTLNEWNRIQIDDVNAPKQSSKEGFYQVPLSILDSKRSSPRDFILNTANELFPNGARKYRLDIRLNTFVTKIIFDQNKRATGVEYVEGAYLYKASPNSPSAVKTGSGTLQATREIIISAGAFNTPQLLKLSGIGPKAELDNLKIPVVVDRPGVGTNLMDRYESSVISKTNSSYQILNGCSLLSTNPDACLERWKNYAPAVKGFYTGNAFPLAVIKKSSVAEKDADIFMFGGPVFFQGFYPGWADVSSLFPAGAKGWWTWVVLKAHVHNTAGTVTLRSGDPLDTPIINLNQFDTGTTTDNGDQKDLQASFEGVQFARNMTRKLNCADGPFEDVLPGPQIKIDDVAGTKNYIKNRAFGHHASCTARIGRIDDSNAVLDSNFKVIGVTGLRVVDASSFPKTPGFFPMLPLYMISEKAADVIIQERDAKP